MEGSGVIRSKYRHVFAEFRKLSLYIIIGRLQPGKLVRLIAVLTVYDNLKSIITVTIAYLLSVFLEVWKQAAVVSLSEKDYLSPVSKYMLMVLLHHLSKKIEL